MPPTPEAAARAVEAHRDRFRPTPGRWWITVAEATRLAGWRRQYTHRLIAAGVIERRNYRSRTGRPHARVNGADVVAILRSGAPPR